MKWGAWSTRLARKEPIIRAGTDEESTISFGKPGKNLPEMAKARLSRCINLVFQGNTKQK